MEPVTPTSDGGNGSGRPVVSPPLAIAIIALVLLAAVATVIMVSRNRQYLPNLTVNPASITQPSSLATAPPQPRTLVPYEGLGTWIDAFDYSPAYDATFVMSGELDAMAASGVKTIFVQSGRLDSRSPDLLEDRWVLAT